MRQDSALITERLERDRESLLDMTLNNRLLNYRTFAARGAEVVGEDPQQVYDTLVIQGKAMSFLPSQSSHAISSDESLFDGGNASEPTPPQARSSDASDLRLQTPHSPAELEKRLRTTYYYHRNFIEEQGINTLYLALGMLTWQESESSDRDLHAPLILVPVELQRSSVRESFRIRYDDSDICGNESLRVKLLDSFGIKLPEWSDESNGSDNGSDEPSQLVYDYFRDVSDSVAGKPRFSVDSNRIALGFFSFAKYLMYVDLDDFRRDDGDKLCEHEVLCALLTDGFQEQGPFPWENGRLDEHADPRTAFHVLDADSSQAIAILDSTAYPAMVIQGPPGTGKSQTITNIIAHAVANSQTVLFVSEKLAALEVVKRRMDECGLGQLCLELHSNKANKREMLAELDRTLNADCPSGSFDERDVDKLNQLRDSLDEYCDAVNSPVGDSEITPFMAYGIIESSQPDEVSHAPPLLVPEQSADWSLDDILSRRNIVARLVDALSETGVPAEHPFYGSGLTTVTLAQKHEISGTIDRAITANDQARAAVNMCASHMGLLPADTKGEVEEIICSVKRCIDFPESNSLCLSSPDWTTKQDAVLQFLEMAERISSNVTVLHSLPADAWDQDISDLHETMLDFSDKWYGFLSFKYHRASRTYTTLVGGPYSRLARISPQDKVKVLETIIEAQNDANGIAQLVDGIEWTIGVELPERIEDWPQITEAFLSAFNLHKDVAAGKAPKALIEFLDKRPDMRILEELEHSCASALKARADSFSALRGTLQLDSEAKANIDEAMSFTVLAQRLETWKAQQERLRDIANLNANAEEARNAGLHELAHEALSWTDAPDQLHGIFEYGLSTRILDRAFSERPILAKFSRTTQERTVVDFAELDRGLIKANRQRVALEHWRRLPHQGNAGAIGDLRHEMRKKRRHLPIRKLMTKCGPAIQKIKPIFMMSPLSVATFLDPSAPVHFDLVVFDEASQVKPVEAFGAISRAKRAIVVGDSKQLPPTAFFDTVMSRDEIDEEIESSSDIESILGLFESKGAHSSMLSWHYRSRHESLIAVSNYEFYDDKLVVFPSPDRSREKYGLVYHYVDGTYDRGGRRVNEKEAKTVARAVMEHAATNPELTLGVATFSMSQMEAIRDEVERLRRDDPSSDAFFHAHAHEPFFVKNIENVQGDERDVIFISVGYGRDSHGGVAMNFGPLNNEGGERRLNVLITRARSRCVVFTNLHAGDIDLRRTDSRGVAVLKSFLDYAENGGEIRRYGNYGEPESPFEDEVARQLAARSYEVMHQVGCAGFRIDMGVVDPDAPGQFLLGIECDGASYHSSLWARDRDRLRQQVLEDKGWIIHRIWSTDWFYNREQALNRLIERIEDARKVRPIEMTTPKAAQPAHADGLHDQKPCETGEILESAEGSKPADGTSQTLSDVHDECVQPYVLARFEIDTQGMELHEVPKISMAKWVARVVEVEGPVHIEEVCRRITENAGLSRVGRRINQRVHSGARVSRKNGDITIKGDFLRMPADSEGEATDVIRDRSSLPNASRKMEYIAPEEIRLAVITAVDSACGIDVGGAITQTCRLFGFARTTEAMRAHVEPLVRRMIDDGVIEERNGMLLVGQHSQLE